MHHIITNLLSDSVYFGKSLTFSLESFTRKLLDFDGKKPTSLNIYPLKDNHPILKYTHSD